MRPERFIDEIGLNAGHRIFITKTSLFGVDSGRRRWRVECFECQSVLHEATTSSRSVIDSHLRGEEGYSAPGVVLGMKEYRDGHSER